VLRTPAASVTTPPRRRRLVTVVATVALAVGAMQLLPQAGANGVVIRQVASGADAGAVDVNRDGIVDLASYGLRRRTLSVGEQPGDGSDLRLILPFEVSADAITALRNGGAANVSLRVRRVSQLTSRRVVIDAYTNGATARDGYNHSATHLATVTPVRGRLAVDVAPVLATMARPGILIVRLRLDRRAPRNGGLTQVNIATSESPHSADRPLLSVSSPGARAVTRPPSPSSPPTVPPTAPPSSQPAPATSSTTRATPPPSTPPTSTTLFSDDFNGSTLDLSKWRPNWLAGSDGAITKPVNSAELSCYDPAQVSVSGGYLHLRAADRACTANDGVTYRYASGLVETAHDFTFTYGRVEARIWLPGSGAIANWPAFWANGTGTWPVTGELDVMEGLDGHACWHFHSTAGGPGGCAPWSNPAGWHTFAAEWSPGSVTYLYDGVQVGRIASGITGSPMYLIFNLGISTSIAPPVQLPSEMLVDWVRVTR
jgi:Glycosyl hydrolases family 16